LNDNGLPKIDIPGLVQNRPLRELTHNEIVNAFKKSGFTLSGHAVKRLKDIRTKAMGFDTLNDIKKVFNRGTKFDAGRGDVGYSYGGMEVIINPKTNNIITFRPAKIRS
jgi:filamentous hemagglutinin